MAAELDKRNKLSTIVDNSYVLHLISTNDDFIITETQSCINCIENKLNCKVYHTYQFGKSDFISWSQLPIRKIKVKCVCK